MFRKSRHLFYSDQADACCNVLAFFRIYIVEQSLNQLILVFDLALGGHDKRTA